MVCLSLLSFQYSGGPRTGRIFLLVKAGPGTLRKWSEPGGRSEEVPHEQSTCRCALPVQPCRANSGATPHCQATRSGGGLPTFLHNWCRLWSPHRRRWLTAAEKCPSRLGQCAVLYCRFAVRCFFSSKAACSVDRVCKVRWHGSVSMRVGSSAVLWSRLPPPLPPHRLHMFDQPCSTLQFVSLWPVYSYTTSRCILCLTSVHGGSEQNGQDAACCHHRDDIYWGWLKTLKRFGSDFLNQLT